MAYFTTTLDDHEEVVLESLIEATRLATSMPQISRSNAIRSLLIEYGPIKIARLRQQSQENSKNHLEVTHGIDDTSRHCDGGALRPA